MKIQRLLLGCMFIAVNAIYSAAVPIQKEETPEQAAREKLKARESELLKNISELENLPQIALEQIVQDLSYSDLVKLRNLSPILAKKLKDEFDRRKLIGYWQTGEIESAVLKGHTNFVWSVVYSPDGKQLASGSWDKTIRLWDVKKGDLIRELQGHTDRVWSVAYSRDGKQLASGSWDNTIRLWRTVHKKK